MAQYKHSFTIDRKDCELELEAEFEIEPFVPGKYSGLPENCYPDEGGFTYLEGDIYIIDTDGNRSVWDGTLTKAEQDKAERDAYDSWLDQDSEPDVDIDDDALLDRDYDFFHDERAIALAGGGKVYY
jgi:hypothetical protein